MGTSSGAGGGRPVCHVRVSLVRRAGGLTLQDCRRFAAAMGSLIGEFTAPAPAAGGNTDPSAVVSAGGSFLCNTSLGSLPGGTIEASAVLMNTDADATQALLALLIARAGALNALAQLHGLGCRDAIAVLPECRPELG